MVYKHRYSSLREVVQLIANRLAAARQHKYANADAAIDDAREQLLEALLKGRSALKG